jgi:hypothetical protein
MDHHRTATTTVTTRLDAGSSASSRRWTPPAPAGAGRTWVDTRSTEVLLAALDRITTEGWDGPTAGELLRVVRSRIVVPLVAASRLQGAAAEQAEASGWERAWEVLSGSSLRQARHPWSVLWVAVRRAVRDEVAATVMQTSVRAAWRYSPTRTDRPGRRGETRTRVDGPVSLEALPFEPLDDHLGAPALGGGLGSLADTLVAAGWAEDQAVALLEAACDHLAQRPPRRGVVLGWRSVAEATGLPQWQVRRVMVLLCGAPGWPGALERLACDGPTALAAPDLRAAVASTVVSHRRPPNEAAEQVAARMRRRALKAAS